MNKVSFLILTVGVYIANGQLYGWGEEANFWSPDKDVAATTSGDGRIIGGAFANDTQVPYIAALVDDRGFFCAGVIISSRWVVTAAHCLTSRSPTQIGVGHLQWKNTIRHLVAKVIYYDGYDRETKANDIGLVKTKTPFIFSTEVKAIALATSDVTDGTNMTASGWGMTQFPGLSVPSDALKFLVTKKVNRVNCTRIWDTQSQNRIKVTDDHICTLFDVPHFEWPGEGTCMGDSGGPLVAGDKLHGLTSFGAPCATNVVPDVFTKVRSYTWWITLQQVLNIFV